MTLSDYEWECVKKGSAPRVLPAISSAPWRYVVAPSRMSLIAVLMFVGFCVWFSQGTPELDAITRRLSEKSVAQPIALDKRSVEATNLREPHDNVPVLPPVIKRRITRDSRNIALHRLRVPSGVGETPSLWIAIERRSR